MSPSIRPRRTPKTVAPALAETEDAVTRNLLPAILAGDRLSVSKKLHDRLTPEDIAEVRRLADDTPELADFPRLGNDPIGDTWLVLNYGVWLRVKGVIERTGLPDVQPPEEIHAMARGPIAAAGGLYEADMVYNAVGAAGGDLSAASHVLDFGCSSGRVLRVLGAAFPDLELHGCDPNAAAIEWVRTNLSKVDAIVSPEEPPLPFGEGFFDVVYAISIWSHFAPELGLRWFDEMHRIIRPGGYLVMTTHGFQSVGFYAAHRMRSPTQCAEIRDALYRSGSWYSPEFGTEGDSGVINPDWGTAFLSPEWILTKLCPQWRVLEYAAGRNQGNQDVWVLQRR